ncbi:hypothetical protein GW7_21101 [Heterocephalus glaber]|uniref:Uncharacterized protein n=1 Tax=Heterocephalus glaber TaxID=10181 RepID=G5AN35_HETGA|nr:hypothetical protein GW7_21101 [Heterocephalus glaber]
MALSTTEVLLLDQQSSERWEKTPDVLDRTKRNITSRHSGDWSIHCTVLGAAIHVAVPDREGTAQLSAEQRGHAQSPGRGPQSWGFAPGPAEIAGTSEAAGTLWVPLGPVPPETGSDTAPSVSLNMVTVVRRLHKPTCCQLTSRECEFMNPHKLPPPRPQPAAQAPNSPEPALGPCMGQHRAHPRRSAQLLGASGALPPALTFRDLCRPWSRAEGCRASVPAADTRLSWSSKEAPGQGDRGLRPSLTDTPPPPEPP